MGVVWTFFSHLSFLFLSPSLWETVRYRLKYCLKGPLSPKLPTSLYVSAPNHRGLDNLVCLFKPTEKKTLIGMNKVFTLNINTLSISIRIFIGSEEEISFYEKRKTIKLDDIFGGSEKLGHAVKTLRIGTDIGRNT